MTAHAAFRNPTEQSFKYWRKKRIEKKMKKWKNVKLSEYNKKAERWSSMT